MLINNLGVPISFLVLKDKLTTSKTLKEYHEKGLMLIVGGQDPPPKSDSNKEQKDITKVPMKEIPKNVAQNNKSKISTQEPLEPPFDLTLIYQIVGVITAKTNTYLELTSPLLDPQGVPNAFQIKSQKIISKIKELNNEEFLLINTERSLFMEYDDFVQFFREVLVCHLYPEYFYVARTITHVKNTYCIRTFSLQNSSHCFIEVSQVDKRYFRGLDYDYSPVRILIGKVDGHLTPGNSRPNLKYIGGVYKQARNVNIELNLEKGSYWVLISFDWRKNTYDATMNYYGREKVLLEKISYNVNRGLLDDFGGLIAKSFGQKIKLQGDKVVLYFYASTFDCLIVEHLVNNFPNKTLFVTRDYSFLDNTKISLLGKYNKLQKVDLKVDPMKCETIMFKVTGVESLEKLHIMLENK